MAYAKLVFLPGTYVLQKLKEITKFITGNITSISDLEFCDKSLSEIFIMDPSGWSLSSGQIFEATGIANISNYIIQSPCVNTSKVKHSILSARIYRERSVSDYGNAAQTINVNSYASSNATSGYLYIQLGTGYSSNLLINETWYFSQVRALGGVGSTAHSYFYGPGPHLGESTVYVFCSNRKILCFMPESGVAGGTMGRSDLAGILEFPDSIFSYKTENLPAITMSARYLDRINSTPILEAYNTSVNISNVFQFTSWYNPILNTDVNRNLNDYGINNCMIQTTPPLTINNLGQTAYPLIPMTAIRSIYGEGIHNYSLLTDVYMTYRMPNYIGQGDTLNVSGIPYVVLQVGDATGNYRALAIKKG